MRNAGSVFAALLLRDGAVCYLCGQTQDPDDPFEIEHVRPRSASWEDPAVRDALSNLALAHRSCNQAKGTAAVVRDA